MDFFISNALAAGEFSDSNPYSLLVMLVVFGVFFYFIIIRPQQTRAKNHKNMVSSISKGDEVMTNGGLIGRVIKVSETDYISIALNDTTEVFIKRDFVSTILPKGTMKTL